MADRARVALVGGDSLLGAEIKDVFAERLPDARVRVVGSQEDGTAILAMDSDEAVVITGLDADTLAEARVVVFAGHPATTQRAIDILCEEDTLPPFVDLSFALEDRAEARLRAPTAEPAPMAASAVVVIAHPAAIVLAAVLRRLHQSMTVVRAVAQIFEPASERGRAGIHEIQQQTMQLLSFKPVENPIYGDQAAFNLLSRYGPDAPVALSTIEHRVEKHLATLLGLDPPVPMPSVRLTQVPVMHGYVMSVWVEFAAVAEPDAIEKALAHAGIDFHGAGLDPPTPVSMAGQDGIAVAAEIDRNNRRAAWLWLAADNFRIASLNAARVVEQVLGA